jgi:acetoin utilization protein AcuB
MRVAEVMTEGAQTVPPTMPAVDAWELMKRKGIHHLVVTEGKEVVGVLSNRDAGGRNGASLRARSTVSDLMTPHVVTIEPTAPVRKAANLMRGRTIGCIPVSEGRRLVGIVTVSDLLDLLGRGVERPVKAGHHRASHHRVAHPKIHRATGVW